VRVDVLPATCQTPPPLSTGCRDSSIFWQIKIVFFHKNNWVNQNRPHFVILWEEKHTQKDGVLLWKEWELAHGRAWSSHLAGNSRTTCGHLPSSQLFTSTYTQSNSIDIKMKKKESVRRKDVLRNVSFGGLLPFDPGCSWWCDAVHRGPDTEKQWSPFDANLLIHCDSQSFFNKPWLCCGQGGERRHSQRKWDKRLFKLIFFDKRQTFIKHLKCHLFLVISNEGCLWFLSAVCGRPGPS